MRRVAGFTLRAAACVQEVGTAAAVPRQAAASCRVAARRARRKLRRRHTDGRYSRVGSPAAAAAAQLPRCSWHSRHAARLTARCAHAQTAPGNGGAPIRGLLRCRAGRLRRLRLLRPSASPARVLVCLFVCVFCAGRIGSADALLLDLCLFVCLGFSSLARPSCTGCWAPCIST